MTDLTATHMAHRPMRPRKGVLGYLDLYRQRRALAQLDSATLKDIGLSREQADAESKRPIWDAPHYWQR